MVGKHIHTLALRALRVNQEVTTHLTRVQHGFLPDKNIVQAQEIVTQLQAMLHDMQTALKAPPGPPPSIPLK
jgi:hypothetical protein